MAALEPVKKSCMGVDCPNEAGDLKCPTCLKMGKESAFCGQDCFKKSWVGDLVPLQGTNAQRRVALLANFIQSEHKIVHKTSTGNIFPEHPRGVTAADMFVRCELLQPFPHLRFHW